MRGCWGRTLCGFIETVNRKCKKLRNKTDLSSTAGHPEYERSGTMSSESTISTHRFTRCHTPQDKIWIILATKLITCMRPRMFWTTEPSGKKQNYLLIKTELPACVKGCGGSWSYIWVWCGPDFILDRPSTAREDLTGPEFHLCPL